MGDELSITELFKQAAEQLKAPVVSLGLTAEAPVVTGTVESQPPAVRGGAATPKQNGTDGSNNPVDRPAGWESADHSNTGPALLHAVRILSPGTSNATGLLGKIANPVGSLIGGLLGSLFGKRDEPQEVQEIPYQPPEPWRFDLGYSGFEDTKALDRDSMGRARLRISPESTEPGQRAVNMATVNVHVQAIDSKSFLDHSHAIAQAVEHALLNGSNLQNTLREL